MSTIHHRTKEVHTAASLPAIGKAAPEFRLTKNDLTDFRLSDLKGKKIILNIFPSIDTGTCAMSVRRFNKLADDMINVVVVCVSKDLPFAQKRFCGAEGIENIITASQYKDSSFSDAYGVDLIDGSFLGLMSRAIVVVDENGVITYTEQVPDIGQEPDYDKAMHAVI